MRWLVVILWSIPLLAQTQADLIWSAGWVATANPASGVIADGAVAIQGSRILAVGPRAEIEARFTAPQHLDQPNAILAPGLVNTHTHAAMSLFRGLANDKTLEDWLQNYIFPAEARNVDREFVRWGTALALLEMALSGTTTFTDMYYFEDAVAEVTRQAGLRGVLGQTVIGFPAPDYKTVEEQLSAAERFLAAYDSDPLITPAVAPHAIYTTPDEALKAARALANRYGKPLLIHVAETKTEYDEARRTRGKTPVETLSSLGVLNGSTLAAHAVWLDDGDISILASHGTGVAHNPSSNMMLASGIAPVRKLITAGVAAGLGTDGPAGSNNDFDMFEEMDLAAKLQKISANDPSALSAEQVFAMATIEGARALGMHDRIGSLEAGKLADIISIRTDAPRAAPMYDVYAQLVYALKGSDVSDVMVNGRMIVRNRVMTTLNARLIQAKAEEYRARIVESLAIR
jgi:5-methylthioadenosine/S-adenosylhomocysteine deaminase